MSDNNIKNAYTLYTHDEVKTMMQACLKGINASNKIEPAMYALYINEDHSIYHTIDEVQNQFSQILRILNAEYNEICKAVEAARYRSAEFPGTPSRR